MKPALRLLVALAFVFALPLGTACGGGPTNTASKSSSNSSTNSSTQNNNNGGSGSSNGSSPQGNSGGTHLDPAVSMPTGFPADFPIYSGARLTEQAQFSSAGKTTWGLTWETLDSLDQVGKWYQDALNHGDWTIGFSGSSNGGYGFTITRKSDSSQGGTVAVSTDSGITKVAIAIYT